MTDDIFDDIDAVRWPLVLDTAMHWQETGECQEWYVLAFINPPHSGRAWSWEAIRRSDMIRAGGECGSLDEAKARAFQHAEGAT